MAARRAGEGERMVRAGKWEGWAPTQLLGVTLEGKRLGILGMGRIGRELAGMARGFRMEIHYRDVQRLPPEAEGGATYHADDAGFLGAIDILSMHIPGGEATRKWLNAERLRRMKPGSLVINSGRGSTVDDEALIASLRSGHTRAAGLDVFEHAPAVNPRLVKLARQGRIVLLPHMGSATHEGRVDMGEKVIVNIKTFMDGHRPPDRILPSML